MCSPLVRPLYFHSSWNPHQLAATTTEIGIPQCFVTLVCGFCSSRARTPYTNKQAGRTAYRYYHLPIIPTFTLCFDRVKSRVVHRTKRYNLSALLSQYSNYPKVTEEQYRLNDPDSDVGTRILAVRHDKRLPIEQGAGAKFTLASNVFFPRSSESGLVYFNPSGSTLGSITMHSKCLCYSQSDVVLLKHEIGQYRFLSPEASHTDSLAVRDL
ncbi:hypothetical protein RRG08_045441 [Elysia crispata]|uniref:Uncharacterized protein n=1 Tax=Elysia crispata TaxID=231223 RepID=A0AAE1E5W9_9GAST|nr:hypothetical protein RRG08_045441 [Elysia crispata]